MAAVRPYRWRRCTYMVDAALDHEVLDRLNALDGLRVDGLCAGHARGPERHGRVVFLVDRRNPEVRMDYPGGYVLLRFIPYLERLSASMYRAHISRYKSNGGRAQWRMEIACEQPGEAPQRWWRELVDVLEDNPDCTRWMMPPKRFTVR